MAFHFPNKAFISDFDGGGGESGGSISDGILRFQPRSHEYLITEICFVTGRILPNENASRIMFHFNM